MHKIINFFNVIILVCSTQPSLQNCKENLFSGVLANLRFSTIIAVYLGYAIGPWLQWITNRKLEAADRSV